MTRFYLLLSVVLAILPFADAVTHFVGQGHKIAGESFKPCHLFGDADLYGIGIRLGLYFQYAAMLICIPFALRDEFRDAQIGFLVIAIAVIINLWVNSDAEDTVFIVDWIILTPLVVIPNVIPLLCASPFGAEKQQLEFEIRVLRERLKWLTGNDAFAVTIEIRKLEKRLEELGEQNPEPFLGWHPFIFLMVCVAISCYLCTMPWLFFRAMYRGSRFGCRFRAILFFAPINIYRRGIVIFYRIFACVGVVFAVSIMVLLIWAIVAGLRYSPPNENNSSNNGSEKPQLAAGKTTIRNGRRVRKMSAWLLEQKVRYFWRRVKVASAGFVCMGYTVAITEVTLVINDIDMTQEPLQSTGQLIALFIGTSNLIIVLWSALMKLNEEVEILLEGDGTTEHETQEASNENLVPQMEAIQTATRDRQHRDGHYSPQQLPNEEQDRRQADDRAARFA